MLTFVFSFWIGLVDGVHLLWDFNTVFEQCYLQWGSLLGTHLILLSWISLFLCSHSFWKWTLQQNMAGFVALASTSNTNTMWSVLLRVLQQQQFMKQSWMIPKNPSQHRSLRWALLGLHKGCSHLPLLCASCCCSTSVLPLGISVAVAVLFKQLTVLLSTVIFLYTPRNLIQRDSGFFFDVVNSRPSSPLGGWWVPVCFLSWCHGVPRLPFPSVFDMLLTVHIELAFLYPPLLLFKLLFTAFPVYNIVMRNWRDWYRRRWSLLYGLHPLWSFSQCLVNANRGFHIHWIHSSFPQPHAVSLTCPFIRLGTLEQCCDETPGFKLQFDILKVCLHAHDDHEHQLFPSAS